MRVLHLITTDATAEASFNLASDQTTDAEIVIMAPDHAACIPWAMDRAMPALRLRPGQPARRLHDAVCALEPDVVHLHGALACDRAVSLSIFAHLPAVLHLGREDFDEAGALRRQVRGIRLDRMASDAAWAVCTRPTPNGMPVTRAQLPIGVGNVIMPEVERATAEWFLAIYRRLLAAPRVVAPAAAALRA